MRGPGWDRAFLVKLFLSYLPGMGVVGVTPQFPLPSSFPPYLLHSLLFGFPSNAEYVLLRLSHHTVRFSCPSSAFSSKIFVGFLYSLHELFLSETLPRWRTSFLSCFLHSCWLLLTMQMVGLSYCELDDTHQRTDPNAM